MMVSIPVPPVSHSKKLEEGTGGVSGAVTFDGLDIYIEIAF
jgi:hypothetical protein